MDTRPSNVPVCLFQHTRIFSCCPNIIPRHKRNVNKKIKIFLFYKKRRLTHKRESLLCWHLLIFPGSFPPSIVSASELNFRVRYGNGWTLAAINTNYVLSLWQHGYYITCFYICQAFFWKLFKKFFKIDFLKNLKKHLTNAKEKRIITPLKRQRCRKAQRFRIGRFFFWRQRRRSRKLLRDAFAAFLFL